MDSMDFHKLSRRQLQTLCKKNTIPANMTNIAMADALTARTNVIGIEEIGQIDSAMPETPLTSRKTTVRRTATKPAVEPESTQTLTRPRRATAKKINKEEDPKESSENTSANETPVPRPGRKRVTSTSVCRKLDAQTQEVKEENKEERPVVHAYSTRRSSRLQSDKKISESVQKLGGRRTEAVKIAALSEEETDDVHMKSSSDATVEVQENKGDNVMVLDAIPDSTQEDLISEDGSSTVVSADVSSSIGEVSSANQDLISESKDEFSVEQSSDLQDMSNEVSSIISDAHVSEIFVSERTLISESKDEITFDDGAHADQDMSFEVSNIASDDLHNMEIKEEPAVEVTVISPNVSGQKTALADQDMSFENSYVASDDLSNMEIKEEPAVEVTVISPNASGQRTTHADQHMSFEDSNVASDDLSNMEIKEEAAVEVTVISPNVSSQKTAQVLEASPVEKKTHDLEKPKLDRLMGSPSSDQVDDMRNEDEVVESNESYEVEKTDDSELKFSFEDDLCDTQFEVQKSPLNSEVFDFGNMKETMDYISDLERCNQVAAPLVSDVIELENEKLDGDEMQVTGDIPVLTLTNATVPSPSVEALECTQFKLDDSVSVEQLEKKLVDSEKCDSIADDKDVKADSLLDDVSTDDEGSDNESDASKKSDYTDESDDDDETVDNDESDDNDEIHDTPVAGLVKSQNPVTPLKSSSAKKTATPNSRMMIKVLEDTDEDNKSGKISLKSNSKLLTSGVAEEKENSDINKGESTAQKSLKKKSLRQLKKMLSEMTITDNKKTMGNENLQVEKRSALQMLNDNCLVGEEDK